MTAWLVAAVIAVAFAALAYAPPPAGTGARALPLALLRGAAALLLAALALDAPSGARRAPAPLVAVDVSASRTRALGARASAGLREGLPAADTVWLVGDSLRPMGAASVAARAATDVSSRLAPLVERASALGRPFVLATDGEVDEADVLDRAPRGSRIVRPAAPRGRDAALVRVDAPAGAAAEDTADVEVRVAADSAGSVAGAIVLTLGTRQARLALPALAPFAEHVARTRLPLAGLAGPTLLAARVESPGDVEARNDTAHAVIEVSPTASVVFVSTAPDPDARAALAVLRGALGLRTRAWLRLTPTLWRAEGSFAPVAEAEVRRAVAAASVVVLHGDTAALGAPRALGRGALGLLVPPPPAGEDAPDWQLAAAPLSPLQPALATLALDSLPALEVGAPAPPAEWVALTARVGRGNAPRPILTGGERSGRRVAVLAAAGLWRWTARPGAAADAAAAIWGGIFDWLAAGRSDARAAVPAAGALRAGDPVRWRRGGVDSVVTVVLVPDAAHRADASAPASGASPAAPDTITVRFANGARETTTAPLPAGRWTVRAPGGDARLVVDAPRELLPRRPVVRAGPVGRGAVSGPRPRLRDAAWAYWLPVLLLCAEWLLRRRAGLR